MNNRALPPRSDSLGVGAHNIKSRLSVIEDELRDARRVQTHGQEEDLRDALGRTICKVEELSSLLSQAYKSQTELETSLKLARSNLQLALANNEMLEDALKRDGLGRGKDVGWRRWSEREGARRGQEEQERAQRISLDSTPSTPSGSTTGDPINGFGFPANTSPVSPVPPPSASPNPSSDSRFFRFRFGSGAPSGLTSRPQSPPSIHRVSERDSAHLTSASLPSLVAGPSKREEELEAQLAAERTSHKAATDEKKALEAEIESLSQALFEEANKMVAQERIKRAETEEELRQAREEKEALKGALRVIEMENGRLRTIGDSPGPGCASPDPAKLEKRSSAVHVGPRRPLSPPVRARSPRPVPPPPPSNIPGTGLVFPPVKDRDEPQTTLSTPLEGPVPTPGPTSGPNAAPATSASVVKVSRPLPAGFEESPWG